MSNEAPWHGWYNTQRWQDLKLRVHKRDLYTCQNCGRICAGKYPADDSPAADHKIRHQGDPVLFWDESNVETLCKAPCHDAKKQAEERRGYAIGCDKSGRPKDPAHPWNKRPA